MNRRRLTFSDRVEISTGLKIGWSARKIAEGIGRHPSVIAREIARNRGIKDYVPVTADCKAQRRRSRPQTLKIAQYPQLEKRVLHDLKHARTPRQIVERLRAEVKTGSVEGMEDAPDTGGIICSHEAIYSYIYAQPKRVLREHGIALTSGRTKRIPYHKGRKKRTPILDIVPISERPAEVEDRRVPGHWEGDLVIGKGGKSAVATLVERTSRYLVLVGLPMGKNSDGLAQSLIEVANGLPQMMGKSLTWDRGSEMARHTKVTLATDMAVYFADPYSPWQRGTNENTNRTIREYFPKGVEITDHQPYLNAVAEEINRRPRACLEYWTPEEVFKKLIKDQTQSVATTI